MRMNIWLQGWQVGLIGILVVFAMLVLLIGLRNLLEGNNTEKPKSRQAEGPGAVQDLPVPAAESDIHQTADDQAIAAAITAALHCMLEAEADTPRGFIVRRIRRMA